MDNKDTEHTANSFRKWSLAIAETVDAHRLIPRSLLIGYSILTYHVIIWYMNIEPVILKANCKIIEGQTLCDVTGMIGPSTQQAALVTTVVGAAAAIIGLYQKSGRDWHKPVYKWFKKDEAEKKDPEIID